jgi:hypothetical protein
MKLATSSTPPPTSPRDSTPNAFVFSWLFVGSVLPVMFVAYLVAIAGVRGFLLIAPDVVVEHSMLVFLIVLVPMSMLVLYPYVLKRMGSSKQLRAREVTWTKSYDLPQLAGKQVGRYLIAALPLEILAMASASLLVGSCFRWFGWGTL